VHFLWELLRKKCFNNCHSLSSPQELHKFLKSFFNIFSVCSYIYFYICQLCTLNKLRDLHIQSYNRTFLQIRQATLYISLLMKLVELGWLHYFILFCDSVPSFITKDVIFETIRDVIVTESKHQVDSKPG
jgi:hypothetical protein